MEISGYFSLKFLSILLIIGLGYFLSLIISFIFPDTANIMMAIWPAAGIGLASLLLNEKKFWLPILLTIYLSGTLANILVGRPFDICLGFMLANVLESLICASFLTFFFKEEITFRTTKEFLGLFFCAFLLNSITAFLGGVFATRSHQDSFWNFFGTWYVADGLGLLIITPFIVSLKRINIFNAGENFRKIFFGLIFLIFLALLTYYSFRIQDPSKVFDLEPYILIPLFLFPALYLGLTGVTVSLLVVEILMVKSDGVVKGPLLLGGFTSTDRLLEAQMFLMVLAINAFLFFTFINEKKIAKAITSKSEKKYKSLFESAADGIILLSLEGVIIEANEAFAAMNGFTIEELRGKKIFELDILTEKAFSERQSVLDKLMKGEIVSFEVEHRHKSGSTLPILVSSQLVRIDEKPYFLSHHRDMSERKATEAQLKKNLAEKEILLKELYHRTKNNMQVISSMLKLQASKCKTQETVSILRETDTRIMAMALVHQMLYQSKDLSRIRLHDYIKNLSSQLFQTYKISRSEISLVTDFAEIEVLIDTAIPIGLILNELFSNSMKYAFSENKKGTIKISLTTISENKVLLEFSDDGQGVYKNFDIRKQNSLGIQTILALAEHQLQGKVDFNGIGGVNWRIEFFTELYSKRI